MIGAAGERHWYVFQDGKAYGPYPTSRLPVFLTPFHRVREGKEGAWTAVAEIPELLALVRAGRKAPSEWYARTKEQEIGPVTIFELRNLILAGYVTRANFIRHETWTEWRRALSTPFFRGAGEGTKPYRVVIPYHEPGLESRTGEEKTFEESYLIHAVSTIEAVLEAKRQFEAVAKDSGVAWKRLILFENIRVEGAEKTSAAPTKTEG